jgi:Luciferase-like monooxygenase
MAVPSIASAPGPSSVAPRRPLKVGVTVPVQEGELAGGTARWADFLEFARVAEDVGFDSLWVPDHLLWREDDGAT